MKRIILIIILFSLIFENYLKSQNEEINILFQKFLNVYSSGDLINSNDILLSIVNSKTFVPESYKALIYNNLCGINTMMGQYEKALEYSNKAEILIIGNEPESSDLAEIYINRAFIYTIQKSYGLAIEYLEKAIRIINNVDIRDNKKLLQNLSAAYLNIGIAYYELKIYKTSSDYFNKSADIKLKHRLAGLSLVYLNIAKTFVKTNNLLKADEFYLRSITSFKKDFGEEHYRLAEVYFDYGIFLRSSLRNEESLGILKKALSICLKNYGEKHTLVSLSYKLIGDHYKNISDYSAALFYYQKALIAVANNFNSPDIFTNPSIDSSLFDIRLLDNLKSKSQALELLASEQTDPGMKLKTMGKSLETIELALRLIDRIRNNYMSEESRMYLADNEKETYLFAAHLACSIYSTTHENSMGDTMYGIAQKAKAAILRNEITGNELLYSASVPDSLREKQNKLTGNIAAYNNLILEENRKINPDSSKITLWKDALFDMNRAKEKVSDNIEKVFPQYHDLIRKTEPIPLKMIQKQLKNDETIIDYLLSNKYSGGKRKMYIFLITRQRLEFRENWLDSTFLKNAEIIRKTASPSMNAEIQHDNFILNTDALYYMYFNLIKPVEDLFKGNKLIIIPDEEIGWLSFDAFLKIKPQSDQADYEGLHYLVNDYTFSYGYSSSLIFSKSNVVKRGAKVFAFSPEYNNTIVSGKVLSSLQGAGDEIETVFKRFRGKSFKEEDATKANFIRALSDPAIFHLAMHSMTDSLNSRYSYLMFDTHNLAPEQGKLYNYEISLTRLKSPMVVLSACNSGSGTLYSGEGLMSLARSFTLAGASSVIKTAWEINDEASAAIITRFYRHLSNGKEKNEAMRLAKLEYLKSSSPAFTGPYFWAAYEVLGDNSPVVRNNTISVLVIASLVVILAGILFFYFKRRSIASDRSL